MYFNKKGYLLLFMGKLTYKTVRLYLKSVINYVRGNSSSVILQTWQINLQLHQNMKLLYVGDVSSNTYVFIHLFIHHPFIHSMIYQTFITFFLLPDSVLGVEETTRNGIRARPQGTHALVKETNGNKGKTMWQTL